MTKVKERKESSTGLTIFHAALNTKKKKDFADISQKAITFN
jgi:hypothetical protein